jgi:hypothetical protein
MKMTSVAATGAPGDTGDVNCQTTLYRSLKLPRCCDKALQKIERLAVELYYGTSYDERNNCNAPLLNKRNLTV